jgi:hypothetical protein
MNVSMVSDPDNIWIAHSEEYVEKKEIHSRILDRCFKKVLFPDRTVLIKTVRAKNAKK